MNFSLSTDFLQNRDANNQSGYGDLSQKQGPDSTVNYPFKTISVHSRPDGM